MVADLRMLRGRGACGRRRDGRVGPKLGEDRVDAGGNPCADVALPEFGDDLLVDDDVGQRVGQDGFKTVADLDPQLLVGRRDDEDGAGVLALLPDSPRPAELIAVVLDRRIAERGNRRDDDLRSAARLLERAELLGQRRDGRRRQNVRCIDDIAGERRERRRRGVSRPAREPKRRQQGEQQQERRDAEVAKAQNFTVGATWALIVVALNGTSGFAP